MHSDGADGPRYTAFTRTLKKWEDGRTPEDGAPDEVTTLTYFVDQDGVEVSDAALIDELSARLARRREG